jgi:hypothetical protein
MPSNRPDMPFFPSYLLVLAFQGPLWLFTGLLWGLMMFVVGGFRPFDCTVGGLAWGLLMWVFCGNFLAVGLAWRRSGALPAADRKTVRAAIEQVCTKMRLVVLTESPTELVLGPKRVLVRFRLQRSPCPIHWE